MGYVAWSVVFGEQPSASKWNILGTNDASFNDGTGIADDAILARHVSGFDKSNLTSDVNPYKFSVYRNAALSSGAGSLGAVVFDTETYDSNNNHDTSNGRYTAPVTGYYYFAAGCIIAATGGDTIYVSLLKNGAEHKRLHERPSVAAGNNTSSGGSLIQLTAGDYVQFGVFTTAARSFVVGNQAYVWFNGFLISRT